MPAEQAAIFERASSFHLPIFLRVGSMNGRNQNYAVAAEKKDFNSVFHNPLKNRETPISGAIFDCRDS